MIFELYARNVCNFRKKVTADDYKQLGFCSLMRAHLSAELLGLVVGAPAISCGPAGDEPLAKLLSLRGCDQALVRQSVTNCSAAGSGDACPQRFPLRALILCVTGHLSHLNQSACTAVLQSML